MWFFLVIITLCTNFKSILFFSLFVLFLKVTDYLALILASYHKSVTWMSGLLFESHWLPGIELGCISQIIDLNVWFVVWRSLITWHWSCLHITNQWPVYLVFYRLKATDYLALILASYHKSVTCISGFLSFEGHWLPGIDLGFISQTSDLNVWFIVWYHTYWVFVDAVKLNVLIPSRYFFPCIGMLVTLFVHTFFLLLFTWN